MKFKYLYTLFIATLALMTSCVEEETVTLLDEIQVSSSYVAIPVTGDSETITITAKQDWAVDTAALSKSKVKWLVISKISGNSGESEITFSAPATLNGRSAEVLINCGGVTQRINVIQGLPKVSTATAAEINGSTGIDGKLYQVSGVATKIENTIYGNWYLTDKTGTVYIYGTLDAKGQTKNFASLGIDVGDEVTVEGPRTTYNTTIELVNVTVVKINKSLIKVDSVKNAALPVEGGEFTAYLKYKGQGVSVEIPEDAKSWLSISSIQSTGTKSVIKFKAAANTGGDRSATITFSTTDGSKESSVPTTLSQKGAIIKASVAEFIAAPVSDTQYRLSGVIGKIDDAASGKIYLRDFSGEVYVYKITDFSKKGLKVGDIITIVGKRAAYNGTPQVAGAVLESSISVTPATISEMLTKPDDPNTYFIVSGVITNIATGDYGNLTITDGTNTLYSYGCYPGYGATGDFRKGLIAAKGIKVGDTITIIGPKGSKNNVPQISNGFYFSHVSAQ